MIDNNVIPYGNAAKYTISLTASNFSMNDDTWRVCLRGSAGEVVLEKADCIQDQSGKWYFVFDSAVLGSGLVHIKAVADVVDYDFESGIRTESWEDTLCRIGRPTDCVVS